MSEYNADTKIWNGPYRRHFYNHSTPFGEVLLSAMNKNPDRVLQINDDSGTHLTSDEIRRKSIRVATALTKMGFKKGDIMMVAIKNQPEMSPVFFGCFLIGAPINPIDVSFSKGEVGHMIDILRPKLIFCNFDQMEKIEAALEDVGHEAHFVTFQSSNTRSLHIDQLLEPHGDEDEYEPPNLGDTSELPLAILCSSGTTGLPKGVCLSHSQVSVQIRNFCMHYQSDKILTFSSPYWVSGFVSLCMAPLVSCTRVCTTEPFSPRLFFSLVENYRITVVFTSPVQLKLILRDPDVHLTDFSSIRRILTGGSIMTNSLVLGVRKVIPNGLVVPVYGMTEFVATCAYNDGPEEEELLGEGSVGVLAPRTEGQIIDEAGNSLGPNEDGQLCLRNSNPFLGYWNNDEATEAAYGGDGWFKTGDHAYFDDRGILHLTGRDKDLLKYMGYQISPLELEVIIERLDGVVAVCVIGIDDPIYGDLPAAAIVKSPDSALAEEDVIQAVAQQVSTHKQLRGGVYFLDAMPRTVSGKIRTKLLKEMLTHRYNERHQEAAP